MNKVEYSRLLTVNANNFNMILKGKGKIKEKDRSSQLPSCTIILFSDLMSFSG